MQRIQYLNLLFEVIAEGFEEDELGDCMAELCDSFIGDFIGPFGE